ncbi:MAG: glycosyltransferase [Candidatus Eremiobacteraeota bacterium]|nr:glycosyltransferase [Candidatus Eremiobacteraeota bacterium]
MGLAARSGTEIVTRDVALGLFRRGHRPIVYAPQTGPLADELRAASIPVVDRIASIAERPDVIHAHHNAPLAAAVARFPDVPAIFVCHDFTAWHDAPPHFPSVLRYVAVDETVADRLRIESGIAPERVAIHRNAVDLDRFRAPERHLPDAPRRALAFVKHTAHLEALRTACAARGLALDEAGTVTGNRLDTPEDVLPKYDLVFTSALSALEAMASGCAVIVCDARGLAGMVTPESYARWRPLNFGLRSLTRRVTADALAAEIDRYDAAASAAVTALARRDAGLDGAIDRYVALYEACIAEGVAPDRAAHDRALAQHLETWAPSGPRLRTRWPWMVEREQLLRDVDAALDRPPRVRAGAPVSLGIDRPGTIEYVSGFGEPEDWGIWTVDDKALMAFRTDASGEVELAIEIDAFVVPEHPTLHAVIHANGALVASWTFTYPRTAVWQAFRMEMPASGAGLVILEFTLSTPRAPSEIGVSGDTRRLGLKLQRLEIRPVPYEATET